MGVRFREGSETNTSVSRETVTYGCKMSPPFCVRPKERKYPACLRQVSQDIINYAEKRAIIERMESRSFVEIPCLRSFFRIRLSVLPFQVCSYILLERASPQSFAHAAPGCTSCHMSKTLISARLCWP